MKICFRLCYYSYGIVCIFLQSLKFLNFEVWRTPYTKEDLLINVCMVNQLLYRMRGGLRVQCSAESREWFIDSESPTIRHTQKYLGVCCPLDSELRVE